MIGCQRGRDGVTVEQLAGHPRILAGDHVGRREGGERAQGDVAEIADGGSHDMKPRGDSAGIHGMAAKGIRALRTILLPSRHCVRVAHRRHPSAGRSGRHAYGEFAIFFTWLIIRRQNDRLALPYDLGA